MHTFLVKENTAQNGYQNTGEKTIEDALQAFLAAPPPLASTVKSNEKEGAIELLRSFICYQGERVISARSEQRIRLAAVSTANRPAFHQTCPATKIPLLIPAFLAFLTTEISPVASQRFVRNNCLTAEELCIWLIRHNWIAIDEGEEAAYRAAEASKDLPRAMRALKRWQKDLALEENAGDPVLSADDNESETYFVSRLAPSLVWLENAEGPVGPIKVDNKTRRELQTGWEVRGLPQKINGRWQMRHLTAIFPVRSI